MPDLIITPGSGKLEFVDSSAQVTRRHSFTLDANNGIVLDSPFSASSVTAPLNVINVTAASSNVSYPFIFADSGETGPKSLLMDSAGGTYNPSTNTATIDITGNSATTTLASNSTNLGGVAAASYVTLTGTQTLTNKTITGTFTGNLTGTGSWATNAVNANTATNSTQLNGQAASYYQTALNGTGFVKISGTTISYDNSTYTPTSRTITAGTGISGGGDLSANRTIAVDDTVSRKYTSTINNVTSSAWTTVCNVVGDNLSSAIRATFNGTSNSVVVNVLADILVNHFQDIIVYAISGFYSKLTIRIITNNDASFTLQVKHDGGTSTNLAVEIFPLNTETITFNPGTLFSTTTFDHICEWGISTSGNGGNNSDIRTAGIFYGAGTGLTGTATNLTAGTATNATQLNSQAASYYTNIPARLGYTPVNQAGDTISGNLTVNGNFAVNGSVTAFSASNIYITSSNLTVTDNILLMNALSPYQRYAGIQMYDSGSGTVSQFLWDGEGDYFFLTGSSVNGKIITGPDGQTNLTSNFIPKATAGYKLGNSLIYDNGTNVGIGTTSPDALLNVVGGHIHVGNATAFDNPASWNRTILIDGTNHARLRVRATALVSGNNNVNEAYLWVDNSVAPYSGLYAGYGFKLETGNSTHITLFPSSGNVGIGVSSPTTALHVSGVISGSSFSGAGTGLTGTAAGLSIGGSAASSTTAGSATTVTGTNGQLLTKDVRTIAPNNIANGYFQFGFTSWTNNNNSPYADYLHLRSYTDSSGGNDNLVMFRKDAIGMRIWQQTFGSASNYSTYKDVAFTDQIGNGTITIAAGTGVGVGTTNTFTTNQSGATTVTISNTGVTSLTTNTGLSSNVSATGAVTVTNTGVTAITTNTGLSTNASATGAVTITNTGVTSNVAGTGISVSGATGAVTITNSGVTSAVAGTGVSVSGATGAVTFSIGQAVGTGNSPTFAGASLNGNTTVTGQLQVNNTTPTAILRLYSGGSTAWNVGVGDSSGTYFNISADFGSILINKSTGNIWISGSGINNTVLHSTSTLTAGNLSGTIPSGVLGNSTHYVGTTAITLNRGSASQTLTGVSIDGNAATATNATQLGGAVAARYVRNDTDGTAGDIYSLITVTKSLTLTTSWQDTGISAGSDLVTGVYILSLYVENFTVGGGHYYETYTGIMSWYAGSTNSTDYDEIPLHKSGHAPNTRYINLRTLRGVSGVLKLQIISSVTTSGPINYVFKFRRMI